MNKWRIRAFTPDKFPLKISLWKYGDNGSCTDKIIFKQEKKGIYWSSIFWCRLKEGKLSENLY